MVALCLNHQNLTVGRHGNDVRVSMDRTVDLEAEAGDVSMPPLDVIHRRQRPHSFALVVVHLLLAGIERFRIGRGKACG